MTHSADNPPNGPSSPTPADQSLVERVARVIGEAIVGQDDPGFIFAPDWDGLIPYLDQGEVDFYTVARAAIAAMPDLAERNATFATLREANVIEQCDSGQWSLVLNFGIDRDKMRSASDAIRAALTTSQVAK